MEVTKMPLGNRHNWEKIMVTSIKNNSTMREMKGI